MSDFFQFVYMVPAARWITLVYLALAVVCGFILFRFARRHPDHRRTARFRLLLALYLGVVLTPGVLTDGFLFSVPAPAFVGFLAVGPAILFSDERLTVLRLTSYYHLGPILGASLLFFIALSLYSRCRAHYLNRTKVAD